MNTTKILSDRRCLKLSHDLIQNSSWLCQQPLRFVSTSSKSPTKRTTKMLPYRKCSKVGRLLRSSIGSYHQSRFERPYSTCPSPCGMKVTICGAAGCTGQPLALLLKQCPLLDEIALYDICATCGYGMELSHVDTKCKVTSFSGRHMLCDALCMEATLSANCTMESALGPVKGGLPLTGPSADSIQKPYGCQYCGNYREGAKVVIIVARNGADTFECSAPIVAEIALQITNVCPSSFTIVATEPIESMVPLIGEIQRLRSVYNPRTLLGCVELNCVRANTALADFLRVPPESVRVPVIGGASSATMVPVLSAAVHPRIMTQEQIECVTSCIMCGNQTVQASKGCYLETPCLAGAYAVARTAINVVKGLRGAKNVIQCAYVDNLGTCAPCCQFFASDVVLGPSGVEKNKGVPELSKFENCLLCNCLPYVQNEIARAVWLVYTMCQQCCSASCYAHPGTCYDQPSGPCVPPVNWTCDFPDACRDEYLASICRDMTCKCGATELCWRPREVDYDAARASNLTHQIPNQSPACIHCKVPRSVRIEKELREKARDPCRSNN